MSDNKSSINQIKVFVIGLDGATFDLIKPWIDEGKLPNFAKIMNEGSYGELESTIHPLTPQAWTSFMTGKNPGKHGIYDFTERKLNSYETLFVNSTFRRSDAIWKILSDAQKKVGVFNVPLTYPVEQVNGFMIAGKPAPGTKSHFTYPESLQEELMNEFLKYELLDFSPQTMTPESCINFLHSSVIDTMNMIKYLMKKYDWDFLMTVFMNTDWVQHMFLHCMDPQSCMYSEENYKKYGHVVFEIYQEVDKAVGNLMKELPENAITVIMSDHGAGPTKKIINLNRWCEKQGLLNYKNEKNVLKKILSRILGNIRIIARYYLPRTWKNEIARLTNLREKVDSHLISSGIDWKKTKCYSSGVYGNIYINLKDREPGGIVQQNEYEELRDHLIKQLSLLDDPETGEKVVDKVYRREELYQGPWVYKAPDLIVAYKDYSYYSRSELQTHKKKDVFEKTIEGYKANKLTPCSFHKLNGIILFHGKHINKNSKINEAKIIDITPTILYLMGIPISTDMDGKILQEVIEEDFLKSNPFKYQEYQQQEYFKDDKQIYTLDEAKTIEERLRGLGYVD